MDSPASSRRLPASMAASTPLFSGFGVALAAAALLAGATVVLVVAGKRLRSEPERRLPPAPALSAAVAPPPVPALPRLLSETGYGGPELLEFSPQYPLWSDGAAKRRFVSIPEGAAIDGSDPDDWSFPVGTRFWKEFSFGERVETRYTEKLPDGSFRFASYVWDPALGDAVLAPEDGARDAKTIAPGVGYDVPSRSDCVACHEGRRSRVLGFNALQLSPDRDPLAPHAESLPPGAVDLRDLVARGLLERFPSALVAKPPRIEATSATARAAQGYLFGNCSGCHNRTGPLASLGLDFDQSLATPAPPSSIGQRSRFRVPGATSSLRIAPGRPEQSSVWFRMSVRSTAQMPPLGTKLVDHAGLDLVARFIASSAEAPHPTERRTP